MHTIFPSFCRHFFCNAHLCTTFSYYLICVFSLFRPSPLHKWCIVARPQYSMGYGLFLHVIPLQADLGPKPCVIDRDSSTSDSNLDLHSHYDSDFCFGSNSNSNTGSNTNSNSGSSLTSCSEDPLLSEPNYSPDDKQSFPQSNHAMNCTTGSEMDRKWLHKATTCLLWLPI